MNLENLNTIGYSSSIISIVYPVSDIILLCQWNPLSLLSPIRGCGQYGVPSSKAPIHESPNCMCNRTK
jgi:hypothetical protein